MSAASENWANDAADNLARALQMILIDPYAHARIDALQEQLAVIISKLGTGWSATDRDALAGNILAELRKGDDQAKQSVSPEAADQLRTTPPTDTNDQGEQ